MTNARTFNGDVRDLEDDFDLGISLHSCGSLTDIALDMCIEKSSAFVLVPCCYGQLGNLDTGFRSRSLGSLEAQDLHTLASAADFTVSASDSDFPSTDSFKTAKKCMQLVDHDRLLRAEELGYQCQMSSLWPLNCSPKNNVITGVRRKNEENHPNRGQPK